MKKAIFIFLLIFPIGRMIAQEIHSSAQILQIMSDSKISYRIDMLKEPIKSKDYSENLNYHNHYRVKTDSGLFTFSYSPNDTAKYLYDKAENFYQSKNTDSAMVYYKLALNADSTLYKVMTYIGQIYGSRGDYENAIYWYKKAINHNYIDYMAHWFLADSYLVLDDMDKAVDEITIAQILNRNNPRIKESLVNIFNKSKRKTEDWYFNPQMELNKISENKIDIKVGSKWIGYALPKALWEFEPGYRESMGVAEGTYSTLEDVECLASLLTSLKNSKVKVKNDTQLKILKKAVKEGYLIDYIFYEIVLPDKPFVAFQLPEETILEIKDYILDCRYPK